MNYFSTFSGIGGFELGIEQAYDKRLLDRTTSRRQREDGREGLELDKDSTNATSKSREQIPTCVGYSEIDKYAIQIYEKNFNHTNYGDITKINAKELPEFDLFVGGFPCQAFSIAGKRGGFGDTRGTLFFEIVRIIRKKQPRLLLLENVKGLLSHDKGATFYTIIATLDELGYDLQWQVLNSKNHGVPQNRERVFVVGHLRGTPRPEVFPFGEGAEDLNKSNGKDSSVCTPPITTQGGKNCRGMFVKVPEATQKGYAEAREGDSINLSVPNSKTRRGRVGKGIANTVDTGMQQHTLQAGLIRRLTPTECMRLQGFPDDWCDGLGISDTQKYKVAGNAVTVNVIRDIMQKLI